MIQRFILFTFLLTNNLYSEFYWSGNINIPYNFYLNNLKNTENPIRFIDLDLNYGFENIELKSNTAFEYQWNQNNYCIINLREYYLSY